MRKLSYRSNYWLALVFVALLAGCSGNSDQTEGVQDPFAGVHVFEGRITEASGGSYSLVIDDMVYALEGNADEIKQFAGQTVEVRASIDGSTLRVVRISLPGQTPHEG